MAKITWLTPFADAWKTQNGGDMAYGQAARSLAPVIKEIGDVEALVRWEWYLRTTPAQYASPTRFAQTHGQYAADYKPLVVENLGRRPMTMGRVV